MSIVQAIHLIFYRSYCFQTRSQEFKLEAWAHKHNDLKVFMRTVALPISTYISLSTLCSSVTVELIFRTQEEFNLRVNHGQSEMIFNATKSPKGLPHRLR